MSEKTPKCIDCGSSPDFVVRLASGRWKCVDCRTEWGENWDWNDDPRTKGLQTNLVRLTSERDEAVRVAGELRKRAPLTVCPLCNDEPDEWVESSEPGALPICETCALDVAGPVYARVAPLTASTGGSSEPQKEIRE